MLVIMSDLRGCAELALHVHAHRIYVSKNCRSGDSSCLRMVHHSSLCFANSKSAPLMHVSPKVTCVHASRILALHACTLRDLHWKYGPETRLWEFSIWKWLSYISHIPDSLATTSDHSCMISLTFDVRVWVQLVLCSMQAETMVRQNEVRRLVFVNFSIN